VTLQKVGLYAGLGTAPEDNIAVDGSQCIKTSSADETAVPPLKASLALLNGNSSGAASVSQVRQYLHTMQSQKGEHYLLNSDIRLRCGLRRYLAKPRARTCLPDG
jgi:hypothetical protein